MKATQGPQLFQPVTLLLETQEEVDAIFALINHRQLAKATGLLFSGNPLSEYKSDAYAIMHGNLCNMVLNS